MWWIYSFYDILLPVLALKQTLVAIRPEITILQFFTLGIIPGTNVQITFAMIVMSFWITAFGALIYFVYPKAKKMASNIDPHPYLPVKMNYTDNIAL